MKADNGIFVRRHGFGGYRWLGTEESPEQNCITHVYPGPNQENGHFDKTVVVAKLVAPNLGRRTPRRIIVESTAIQSFDDAKWSREWSEGVYSIARAVINICDQPAPTTAAPAPPRLPVLKISQSQSQPRASIKRTRSKSRKSKFTPNSRCAKPSDPGRCNNTDGSPTNWVQPYYFDENIGACRKFFYSGCGGNNNRFPTAEECEAWCVGRDEPCAKTQNEECPKGVKYSWKSAYYLNSITSQCIHYWYRSCSEDDEPQFPSEEICKSSCLGIAEKEEDEEDKFVGPKGRCFELFDKDAEMCPVWATKEICSPYPEEHNNHWAHFNCRLSCCKKHGL
jgi:hypothetical protein